MIMKKIILSLLVLMSATGVFAQSQIYNVNGIYYRLVQDPESNNTSDLVASVVTMGETNHYQGSISIPSSVTINGNNYSVGTIYDMAFKTCKSLTSITIPASIKQIPKGAFYGCDNLVSITVADGNPFYDSRDNCNAVMETATNTLIAGCKTTVVPATTARIGEAAFYGCKNLVSINLPNGLTSIGRWAFLDCAGLATVTLPTSMTAIETGVFENCTNLALIEIPSSIVSIGENAFHNCNNLAIEIPATATEISGTAFSGIGTLYWNSNDQPSNAIQQSYFKNLVFGENVTEITWNVGCFGAIKSVTIPNSVKKIGNRSFAYLRNLETLKWNSQTTLSSLGSIVYGLKHIIFGDSVLFIDPTLFIRCDDLESIEVDTQNPYFDSRDNCNAVIGRVNAYKHYCDQQNHIEYDSYITKDYLVLGCKNTVIPNDVKYIGHSAFENKFAWDTKTSVTIPSSVIYIGNYAFASCGCLESLHIPASVTTIAPGAFMGCFGLNSITVDPDNTVYNSNNNCNAIIETGTKALLLGCKNTVIPNGIEIIQDWAFSYAFASNLRDKRYPTLPKGVYSLTLPSSVKRIGYYAFEACDGLSVLSVPQSVTEIGAYAFKDCNRLTSITIPKGLTTISEGLLYGCCNLKSIDIPENVKSIGEYAFYGCGSVESLIIPEGVTVIKHGTFSYCNSLSYLSLPSTIVEFQGGYDCYGNGYENYSFEKCRSLLTAGPKGGGYNYEFNWKDTIPANAFRGLSNLQSVYIPRTIKAVYECDTPDNSPTFSMEDRNKYFYNSSYNQDIGHVGTVFYGCDSLKSVAVSFNNTKLMKLWIDYDDGGYLQYGFKEKTMDFNLYKSNSLQSITILDGAIKDLKSILTESIKEVVVSQYVNSIDSGVFSFIPYSAELERYYYGYGPNGGLTSTLFSRSYPMASNLEKITVESGNSHYSSVDGVLLNADGSKLLLCPSKRKNGYLIPETVVEVTAESFMDCNGLKFVRIPGSVKHIGDRAFENCTSIGWITFEGSPEIGLNAFWNCDNIQSVAVHSGVPGKMNLCDSPRTVMTGDYTSIISGDDLTINAYYNDDIKRSVCEISSPVRNWDCYFDLTNISAGKYKMIVGLLTTSNGKPSYFHPAIYGFNDETGQREIIYEPKVYIEPRRRWIDANFSNDIAGYDSVFITDTLVIPSGYSNFIVKIHSAVTASNESNYSREINLDRIFFEPIGDFPEEAYTGPFTQQVFNNAMLYVPDGAVNTYRAAIGWKLFKNIAVDTSVDPIRKDDKKSLHDAVIYDMTGRRTMADTPQQLPPGLYIINGKKYLKR